MQCKDKPHHESHQLIKLINHTNLEKYKISIQNFHWSRVNQYDTCQDAFSNFSDTLKIIFNDSFPVIKVKQRYRNHLLWLTDELNTDIKTKNKLYKKYDTGFN